MSKAIAVHSTRGGTGKSHLTANLGTLAACAGWRVALLDTALQSAGLHHLFGVELAAGAPSLAGYLGGECEIEDAVLDVSAVVAAPGGGSLLLVPAAADQASATALLARGYDLGLLADACSRLVEHLDLDLLFLDTHPGISNEAGLSVALADTAVLVVRPDAAPPAGAPDATQVPAFRWPRRLLVVNMMRAGTDEVALRARLRASLGVEPVAVVPFSQELSALNSERVFVCDFPEHALAGQLRKIVDVLTAGMDRRGGRAGHPAGRKG